MRFPTESVMPCRRPCTPGRADPFNWLRTIFSDLSGGILAANDAASAEMVLSDFQNGVSVLAGETELILLGGRFIWWVSDSGVNRSSMKSTSLY